jgi:hypothetical protein
MSLSKFRRHSWFCVELLFWFPTRQQRNAPLSGHLLIVIVRTIVKLSPNFLTGTVERCSTCPSASIAIRNENRRMLLDRFMDRVSLTS